MRCWDPLGVPIRSELGSVSTASRMLISVPDSILSLYPTRATTVPAGPDWVHEIKHDDYRLIVQCEGERVKLYTRRGHDWSDRFPLISEAASASNIILRDRRGGGVARRCRAQSLRPASQPASILAKLGWSPSTCWRSTVTTSGHSRCTRVRIAWRAHTLVAFKAARDIRIRSALQLSLLCLASRLMRRLARASNRRTAHPPCHMAERCLRADIVEGAVLHAPEAGATAPPCPQLTARRGHRPRLARSAPVC